ncbi:MAG: 5-oxoprolinase subunit PxpB [Alphaproteobacteria bacterium]|nr:5-oxoprolinase subunit PxpB [Alphaproteobacteria bacterium]
MAADYPKVLPIGDAAFLVLFGDTISDIINDAAVAFCQRVERAELPGVVETVSTSRSVLVRFDPLAHPYQAVHQELTALLAKNDLAGGTGPVTRRRWDIPVCYGGAFGPDLADVAALIGGSEEEAVEEHQSTIVRINMVGFAPGVLYCGLLPSRWDLPRLQHAKSSVPAGSVSVAVRQTVIYPIANPTGWRTIGRTPIRSFDPSRDPPMLMQQGDEICFRAIDEDEFAALSSDPEKSVPIETPDRES